MRTLKKKSAKPAHIPRARNAHSRQRQRLIDACISALHIYGPSRTTVEKVVAIAKMSPGIVRFYFASKAAMLVASLQFLSAEFYEQLLVPVTRLKSRPVAALELMVDLYLDPEIASPRKVSVWYAFWGEASSRQEYYDICGQKDESFAALVRELIGQLIVDTSQPQLDPDGIALGLIGALEILWQDFAFRTEADIDRAAAKGRCMAYLRSIFPSEFASTPGTARHGAASHAISARSAAGDRRFAGWVYDNARLFAIERELVFRNSWQFAGHRTQIAGTGDFLGVDLGIERILLVRDAMGEVRAFRNSCSEAPHILVAPPRGSLGVIDCAVHGLSFGLDGKRCGPHGTADLTALSLRLVGDLMLVRSGTPGHSAASIASAANEGARVPKTLSWSARFYAGLLGSAAESGMGFAWPRRFLAPNHLIEVRQDGLTILQVLPVAPGRSLLRRHHLTLCAADRPAHAAQYVASRLNPHARWSGV